MPAFLLTKDGAIATLTFNRPEKRNPLDIEWWESNSLLARE